MRDTYTLAIAIMLFVLVATIVVAIDMVLLAGIAPIGVVPTPAPPQVTPN